MRDARVMGMPAIFGVAGALTGLMGVAAGAFAAHGLRGALRPELLQAFETGARYQLMHALALVLVALALDRPAGTRSLVVAGWCFTAGQALFGGSLYLLALTGAPAWGAITPLGGLGYMAGWIALGFGLLRRGADATA
jgi:uncharacterized membrane protein YgdD (TMEM256/DUF423 family)